MATRKKTVIPVESSVELPSPQSVSGIQAIGVEPILEPVQASQELTESAELTDELTAEQSDTDQSTAVQRNGRIVLICIAVMLVMAGAVALLTKPSQPVISQMPQPGQSGQLPQDPTVEATQAASSEPTEMTPELVGLAARNEAAFKVIQDSIALENQVNQQRAQRLRTTLPEPGQVIRELDRQVRDLNHQIATNVKPDGGATSVAKSRALAADARLNIGNMIRQWISDGTLTTSELQTLLVAYPGAAQTIDDAIEQRMSQPKVATFSQSLTGLRNLSVAARASGDESKAEQAAKEADARRESVAAIAGKAAKLRKSPIKPVIPATLPLASAKKPAARP